MARDIKRIIVHCSDSKWGNAAVIDGWHKENGWKGIGYHFVIPNGRAASSTHYDPELDGTLEPGRNIDEIGAHAKGHNTDSVGICLIGGADGLFSPKQIQTLLSTIRWLQGTYGIPDGGVIGHRDVEPHKTCPGFDVGTWLQGEANKPALRAVGAP